MKIVSLTGILLISGFIITNCASKGKEQKPENSDAAFEELDKESKALDEEKEVKNPEMKMENH